MLIQHTTKPSQLILPPTTQGYEPFQSAGPAAPEITC